MVLYAGTFRNGRIHCADLSVAPAVGSVLAQGGCVMRISNQSPSRHTNYLSWIKLNINTEFTFNAS